MAGPWAGGHGPGAGCWVLVTGGPGATQQRCHGNQQLVEEEEEEEEKEEEEKVEEEEKEEVVHVLLASTEKHGTCGFFEKSVPTVAHVHRKEGRKQARPSRGQRVEEGEEEEVILKPRCVPPVTPDRDVIRTLDHPHHARVDPPLTDTWTTLTMLGSTPPTQHVDHPHHARVDP
ncbi:hypothetical protein CRUP_019075 [Coryphaenoides rupestris]|nr:hypothetical protein CRUP_019075 [Coryphaenoides rupestris]